MSIILDGIYAIGLAVTSPIWLYRMIRHGRYRHGIPQRFGAVPKRYGLQPTIWIHGVSLGEINVSRTLVKEIHSQLPDYRVVISTTTDTGMAAAKKAYTPDHLVFHWPFDFSTAVKKAIRRINPSLVVLMEGDVWPNFVSACNKSDIPVVVVNGRMSPDKGYPGYKKLGTLAAKLFNGLACIGVQDEIYGECFAKLSVKPEKILVTGMMKFDTVEVACKITGQEQLAEAVGVTSADRLIVAGGTGPGEEKLILDMFRDIKSKYPDVKLAIVPRKPERFNQVADLIVSQGFKCIRRSENPDGSTNSKPDEAVILGDTMGELRKFYALSYCVFVGRSLIKMGGSDMIEAAAMAKPVAFGPHTFNFPQAAQLAQNGCAQVGDITELQAQFKQWLDDPQSAQTCGTSAQKYIISMQGATRCNVEMICDVLNRIPAMRDGSIATDRLL